jgi:hypothetical protein
MRTVRVGLAAMLVLIATFLAAAPAAAQDDGVRMYNTAKQKLMAGEGIVGVSVSSPDPDSYCAAANAGFDFTWIEMQHSPLSYQDVARMIWACRGAAAIPFIRVPDATEGAIQKAVDLGALGNGPRRRRDRGLGGAVAGGPPERSTGKLDAALPSSWRIVEG